MRKLLWCCLAAGTAVCGAVGAVAYISQYPDSALGRLAFAAAQKDGLVPGHPGATNVVELIPPDPVPVVEPSDPLDVPALPGAETHLPPAVAALIPPIIIHDEEDLNASSGPVARAEPPAAVQPEGQPSRPPVYDVEEIGRRLDGDAEVSPQAASPMMPYCTDDAGVPIMPACADDPAPPMPPAGDDALMRRPGAWEWWLGFFSGPSHLMADPSAGRCQEDIHYGQQYPGAPYTSAPAAAPQPARTDGKAPPAFPGAEESSEPPAHKVIPHIDPYEILSRPRRLQTPSLGEPQSDTMEMRPSDWKPYSLEPGPF